MGKNMKRDLDHLSRVRREGMRLLTEGVLQSDIARELDVSRQTVSRWGKMVGEYPDDQPWRARPVGRPAGLSSVQRKALIGMLADRYVDELDERWSLARVTSLIEKEFGLSYSRPHVWSILMGDAGHGPAGTRRLGLSFWPSVIEQAYPELKGRMRLAGGLGADGKRRHIAEMVNEVRSRRASRRRSPS